MSNNCRICGKEIKMTDLNIGPNCFKKIKDKSSLLKGTLPEIVLKGGIVDEALNSFEFHTTSELIAEEGFKRGVDLNMLGPSITSLFLDGDKEESNYNSYGMSSYLQGLKDRGIIPLNLHATFSVVNYQKSLFNGLMFLSEYTTEEFDKLMDKKFPVTLLCLSVYRGLEEGSKELGAYTREFGTLTIDPEDRRELFLQNSNWDGLDFKGQNIYANKEDFERITLMANTLKKHNGQKIDKETSDTFFIDRQSLMEGIALENHSRIELNHFFEYFDKMGAAAKSSDKTATQEVKIALAMHLAKRKTKFTKSALEVVKNTLYSEVFRNLFTVAEIDIIETFLEEE